MSIVYFLLAGLIGYFFGALPSGLVYVRVFKGIDIRDVGSGRVAGTNAYRAAGLPVGLLTGITDVLKGAIGVWITHYLFAGVLGETWLPWAATFSGVMAVTGHNWSIFLKWGGGAGTSPNVGWASTVWWPLFPISLLTMLLIFWTVGMASVVSLTVAALIPIIFAVRYFTGIDPTPAYLVGGLVTAVLVAYALRPNIKRIFAGTERVVGPRAKRQQQSLSGSS